MPKDAQKSVVRRRPGKVQSKAQKPEKDVQAGYGAPRRIALKEVKIGGSIPLRPTGPADRPFEDVKEQIQESGSLIQSEKGS